MERRSLVVVGLEDVDTLGDQLRNFAEVAARRRVQQGEHVHLLLHRSRSARQDARRRGAANGRILSNMQRVLSGGEGVKMDTKTARILVFELHIVRDEVLCNTLCHSE